MALFTSVVLVSGSRIAGVLARRKPSPPHWVNVLIDDEPKEATLPGIIGIGGTLFFGWGLMLCVVLAQANVPVGLYNTLKPLLEEQKRQEKLLSRAA